MNSWSCTCISWKLFVLVSQDGQHRATQARWLKQQKCVVSQFQSLEIQNQGVRRAMPSLKPVARNPFLPFPSFWQLPAIHHFPQPAALPLIFCHLTVFSPCLCPLLMTPDITSEATSHCHHWNPKSRWAGKIRTQFYG